MRYIDLTASGGPEVMVVKEMAEPVPAAGEILIRVRASGVNRPDVLQRSGMYPPPPGASPILGLEVAGEVAGVGTDVSAFSVGDPVCALTNGGGYAEFVAVPAGQVLPIPRGLTVEEAAALPETCFTVWTNVFDRAGLKAGERFLVHGGSSGIGTTAIQMATALGVEAYATAGSPEKCRVCEELGAIVAVNYREQDFVEVLGTATDGQGMDVILDMVGGDYVDRNLELAAMDGRIVSIAFLKGSKVNVDLVRVLMKRLIVTGSTLRPQPARSKAGIASNLRKIVWPLIEEKRIRPVLAARFPLSEVPEAHRLMESSRHIGKIVLTVTE